MLQARFYAGTVIVTLKQSCMDKFFDNRGVRDFAATNPWGPLHMDCINLWSFVHSCRLKELITVSPNQTLDLMLKLYK